MSLPDGTELSSGKGDAIVSLILHREINSDEDLAIGSACASYIEVELWTDPDGSLRITAGDELTLYQQTAGGTRKKAGVYLAEKPTRSKRNTYRVTAYDRMTLLDFNFSDWLYANQIRFPMSGTSLLSYVKSYAETLGRNVSFSFSSGATDSDCPKAAVYQIQAFYADDLTARQIVSWIAEMRGSYVAADPDGTIVFRRYTDRSASVTVAPTGTGGAVPYFGDSLSYDDYTVAAVQKVQIRQSDRDIGVVYPDEAGEKNTYAVQGNLLLTSGTDDALRPLAQELYGTLRAISYTPCSFSVSAEAGLEVGQFVRVRDVRGRTFTACLMSAAITSGKASYEGTGSASRESSSAVNNSSYKNLSGKMLEIKSSIDGLEIKASELSGNYASLKATVDGISAEVSADVKIVGGENLVLSTEDMANAAIDAAGGTLGTYTFSDGAVHVVNASTATRFSFSCAPLQITKGVTYCISVMYKHISGADTLYLQFETKDPTRAYVISRDNQMEIAQDDGWVLRYGLFTATTDAAASRLYLAGGAYNSNYTNEYYLLHPMVQAGNAPTAWTSSTGDYVTEATAKSLISQSAEEIKASVEKTAVEAANTVVGDALKSYSTTTETKALIRQSADSITSTVSKNTTKIDELSGTVGALSVGGRNLLMNCAQYTKDAPLTVTVNNGGETTDGYNESLGIYTSVSLTAGTYWLQAQTNGKWSPAHYNGGANASNKYVALWLNRRGSDGGGTDYIFVKMSADNPAKVTISTEGIYYLRTNLYKQSSESWPTVKIWNIKLERGSIPSDWTPAPEDVPTSESVSTQIKQTVNAITLTASTSGTTSKITLKSGSTTISSASISFSGVVTFTDLSNWQEDKTIINGGNITTGQLHNKDYSTVYDLDNAWIRTGTAAAERVYIDNRHIAWYATTNTGDVGLTGVMYSEAGVSYIGANSKYVRYGWLNGLTPSSYVGAQMTYNRSDDSDFDFTTTRVGVGQTLNVQNLSAWGSKSRVVRTSFGAVNMAAFETPIPTFADWGRGVCDGNGQCILVPDPRYAETIAQAAGLTYLLTDCDGSGALWAQDCGDCAIVHGRPGQAFAWLAMAAQRGYEGIYAELADVGAPPAIVPGADMAEEATNTARAEEGTTADDLLRQDDDGKDIIDILLGGG